MGDPHFGHRRGSIFHRTLMTEGEHRKNDGLVLDNGEKVTVSANAHEIKIGCVTITWPAWERLKQMVSQMSDTK